MQPHIVLKPGPVTVVDVGSAAVPLETPDTESVAAIIVVENADVRMRWDGEDPTATVGQIMKADSVWEVTGRDLLVNMRFIAESSAAKVTCSEIKGY